MRQNGLDDEVFLLPKQRWQEKHTVRTKTTKAKGGYNSGCIADECKFFKLYIFLIKAEWCWLSDSEWEINKFLSSFKTKTSIRKPIKWQKEEYKSGIADECEVI